LIHRLALECFQRSWTRNPRCSRWVLWQSPG